MRADTKSPRGLTGYDINDINDKSSRRCFAYDRNDQNDQSPKSSVVPILAAGPDLVEFFNERAAIREYEGHRPRDIAERLAYWEIVETWCGRHPQRFAPGMCAGCGKPLNGKTLDLPDGARVHFNDNRFACLIAYGSSRRARAKAALAELGLFPPDGCSE
jgi:hypothetical protein